MKPRLDVKRIECILPAKLRMPGLGIPSRAWEGARWVCSWGRTPALVVTVTSSELLLFGKPLPPIEKMTVTMERRRSSKRVAFRFTGERVTRTMTKVVEVAQARKSAETEDAMRSTLAELLAQLIDYIEQLDQ